MAKLDDYVEGRVFPFTIELRDPLGNSFIAFRGMRWVWEWKAKRVVESPLNRKKTNPTRANHTHTHTIALSIAPTTTRS